MIPEDHVDKIGPSLQFIFTRSHLIEETSSRKSRGRRAWPLEQLSPELDYTTGRPNGVKERLTGGAILFGIALCVYASDFHARIPLLAPFLTVSALFAVFGGGLGAFRVETWTTIRKSDGSTATWFQHRDTYPDARLAFEEAYADAVK